MMLDATRLSVMFFLFVASSGCSDENNQSSPGTVTESVFACRIETAGPASTLKCQVLADAVFIKNVHINRGNCPDFDQYLKDKYETYLDRSRKDAAVWQDCSRFPDPENANLGQTTKSVCEKNRTDTMNSVTIYRTHKDWFVKRADLKYHDITNSSISKKESELIRYNEFSSNIIWNLTFGDEIFMNVKQIFGDCRIAEARITYIDAGPHDDGASDKDVVYEFRN
ncbi:MAG: hypothetical protein QM698_13460 [Micropepsaceae bacterium]